MNRKFLSPWGGLGNFLALVPVVGCISYGITMLAVGASVGRQSSTFVVAPFLVMLAAPFLGAMGWVVGRLAARILGPLTPDRWYRALKWCYPLLLVVIAGTASWQASQPIFAAERDARPRVIVNTVGLQLQDVRPAGELIQRAARVYDYLGNVNLAIPWGESRVHFATTGSSLQVTFTSSGSELQVPLPGIDYVIYVDAISLTMGNDAQPVLAMLITGRATGRRDLLAVASDSGQLLYLELLDRTWDFRFVPLAIAQSGTGDLILVGQESQQILVFAPPDSAR